MQGAGAAVGPVIAGLAMSAFQRGLSYTLIVTQILMAVWGVYRLTRRAAPPETHQGPFVVEPSIPVGTALSSGHSRTDQFLACLIEVEIISELKVGVDIDLSA
jgi:hypothetical protein